MCDVVEGTRDIQVEAASDMEWIGPPHLQIHPAVIVTYTSLCVFVF